MIRFEKDRRKSGRTDVREAVQTFLFGFDVACVAFCGAALKPELGRSRRRSRRVDLDPTLLDTSVDTRAC
jgi:hypothetical protein